MDAACLQEAGPGWEQHVHSRSGEQGSPQCMWGAGGKVSLLLPGRGGDGDAMPPITGKSIKSHRLKSPVRRQVLRT